MNGIIKKNRIVILGGGFASVKCALELQKKNRKDIKITLISNRKNFEYHGALYRTVAGYSPAEVCIPIRDILDSKKVELIYDSVVDIDVDKKRVEGRSGSYYSYDTVVVGLGSETNYFGIKGLEEFSHGMKTVNDALALKRHINQSISQCLSDKKEEQLCGGHFVVVGGGATGTELAAELAVYTKKLAKEKGVEPSLITIDLIEAMPRLMPTLPEEFAKKMEERIRALGVNVYLNRAIQQQDIGGVHMKDVDLRAKTVIWTAGVRANRIHETMRGVQADKRGRVLVDGYMKARSFADVFVVGDGASTSFSGMAQTALQEGSYVADVIVREMRGKKVNPIKHRGSIYAIPAGPGWAGTIIGSVALYGRLGWVGRRLVDMVVFTSFLPWRKAWSIYRSKEYLSNPK